MSLEPNKYSKTIVRILIFHRVDEMEAEISYRLDCGWALAGPVQFARNHGDESCGIELVATMTLVEPLV